VSEEKDSPGTIPFRIAAACAAIICAFIILSVLTGNPVPFTGLSAGTTGLAQDTATVLPGTCQPAFAQGLQTPVVAEPKKAATLTLNLPTADDRIPYTERDFDQPVEAAVAWWMSPGFMDNTTEFRGYERQTAEGKLAYPEEHRIFFTFIQDQLDLAGQQSVLKSDQILFRGINPSVAGIVMNTSRYHEPAFASTSYDISFSLDAFGVRSPDGYRNVLVLERYAGDHALYINEDEREYLLPRGSDWIVTRAASIENLTVMADFPLHDRSTGNASFDHVRLIYIRPVPCL